MYAVLGVWAADPAKADQQYDGLRNEVIPLVRDLPGFVQGLWMGDDDTGRSHTNLIFDTEQHARDFTDFMAAERLGAANDAGIALLGDFAVVPVIAETRLG